MIAKIAIVLAVAAFAYGGVIAPATVGVAHTPAATVKLANVAPVVTYAAAPAIAPALTYSAIAHQQVAYAPAAVAYSAPVVHSAPAVVAAPAVIPQAVAYATAPKVVVTHEPVEQHGYQIAY